MTGATAEVRATKRLTHADQILAMLKKAGPKGCTTEDLLEVTHRFSARIWDLKQKGWNITTTTHEGKDTATFVLAEAVATVPQTDLLRAPAPAPPSSDFDDRPPCTCNHPAAWHRPVKGTTGHKCAACPCTHYQN